MQRRNLGRTDTVMVRGTEVTTAGITAGGDHIHGVTLGTILSVRGTIGIHGTIVLTGHTVLGVLTAHGILGTTDLGIITTIGVQAL